MALVDRKPWYASKTVWVGLVELALGIAEVVSGAAILGSEITGYALAAVGALTLVLRFMTERPVGARAGVDEVA